ncbi:hypothetical protein ACLM5J_03585 [Nocardioides sp. Bht2]|uniref:hypothetical protein n=1 Tax=Nocardioides sp. Bht2 TaxID=3392297 RepID=UPI0039B54533
MWERRRPGRAKAQLSALAVMAMVAPWGFTNAAAADDGAAPEPTNVAETVRAETVPDEASTAGPAAPDPVTAQEPEVGPGSVPGPTPESQQASEPPETDEPAPTPDAVDPADVAEPTVVRLEPTTSEAEVGADVTFTLWAGDDTAQTTAVTDEATFEFVGGSGTCTGNVCSTTRAGNYVIKASWRGLVDVASLRVYPGAPATFELSPARVTALPGEPQLFDARWSDAGGNPIESFGGGVEVDHGPDVACTVAGPSITCRSAVVGSHTITASPVSDPSTTAQAQLVVEDGPGAVGGLETVLGSETFEAGAPFAVTARGLDIAGEPVDVTAQTTFRILHSGGSDLTEPVGDCAAGSCRIERAGAYQILSIYRGRHAYAQITVSPAAPVEMLFSPSDIHVGVGTPAVLVPVVVDRFGNRSQPDDLGAVTLRVEAPAQCMGVLCGSMEPGSYRVDAAFGDVVATASLRVHPAATADPKRVASIRVAPAAPTVPAGEPGEFVVYGFDAQDQPLGTVSDGVTLAVDGAGSWRTPRGRQSRGCEALTCSSTLVGEFGVTATFGALSATSTLTVVAGDRVGNGLAPANAVVRAGERQTYVYGSLDEYGNVAGRPSGFIQMSMVASSGAQCDGYECWANTPGTYVIGVDRSSRTGSDVDWGMNALLTVIPADVERIEVTATPRRVAAGEEITLSATAYDPQDRELGDVTEETTFTSVGAMSCVAELCRSTTAGTFSITGTLGELSDRVDVEVVAGDADHDSLTPQTATLRVGEAVDYSVSRYDEFDNLIAVVTSAYSFDASPGATCDDARCSSRRVGSHDVTATAFGQPALRARFTVELPEEAYLVVSPAEAEVRAGERAAFTAVLHDESGGVVEDVTEETTFTAGEGASCELAACTGTATGRYLVNGVYGELTDDAALVVTAAEVDRIVLSPDAAVIDAGDRQSFGVTGYDAFGNVVGELTEDSDFAISGNGRCESNACGAERGGAYRVTASYRVPGAERAAAAAPGELLSAEAALTVRAADTDDPDTDDPGTGESGDNDDADDPSNDAPSSARDDAQELPATGATLVWWHLLLALLLVTLGGVGLRRRRG